MINKEMICDKDDKIKLDFLMKEVKEILDKYQYKLDYSAHILTCIYRAKRSCDELQRNVELLYM